MLSSFFSFIENAGAQLLYPFQMFTLDTTENRDSLVQFIDQPLAMVGLIQNVSCPEPGTKNICLIKVRIAPIDNSILFDNRAGYRYDHLWIKDNRPPTAGYTSQIADIVEGHVVVKPYQRSNGETAYTLALRPGIISESAFIRRLNMELLSIRNAHGSVDDKSVAITETLSHYLELLVTDKVLCFTKTRQQLLDLLNDRSSMMRFGGVFTSTNRAGRRAAKRLSKRIPGFELLPAF